MPVRVRPGYWPKAPLRGKESLGAVVGVSVGAGDGKSAAADPSEL